MLIISTICKPATRYFLRDAMYASCCTVYTYILPERQLGVCPSTYMIVRIYRVIADRSRTLRRPLWQWWRVCRWTLNSRRSPTRCVPHAGPPACSSAWRGHRGRSTPPQVRTIPGCQTCLGWNSSSTNDNTINNSLTITNKCLIGLSSHVNKVNHVWYVWNVRNSIALVYILRPHNMSII